MNQERRQDERYLRIEKTISDGFATQAVAHSELKSAMQALELRERERNGQVRDLTNYRIENERQMGEHLRASAEDSAELEKLKQANHDGTVRQHAWRDLIAAFVAGGGTIAAVLKALTETGIIGGMP